MLVLAISVSEMNEAVGEADVAKGVADEVVVHVVITSGEVDVAEVAATGTVEAEVAPIGTGEADEAARGTADVGGRVAIAL